MGSRSQDLFWLKPVVFTQRPSLTSVQLRQAQGQVVEGPGVPFRDVIVSQVVPADRAPPVDSGVRQAEL